MAHGELIASAGKEQIMERKKYRVAITETYRKVVTVEASSPREAHIRARDAYNNTEITLNETNLEGAEYHVLDETEYTEGKFDSIDRKE